MGEGFFLGLELELFDLAIDPEERTNLAEKQEEVIYLSIRVYNWLEIIKIQEGEVGERWRCWRRKPPEHLH